MYICIYVPYVVNDQRILYCYYYYSCYYYATLFFSFFFFATLG